ncbi:MAG: penicillin-binding protein activator [Desulfobacteraceae bacterium]|nr:penicillin-binding protein activator [Desulfobacteraceae bacterium]
MKSKVFQKNSLFILFITILFLFIFASCATKKIEKPSGEEKPIEIPITEKDILEQEDIDWSDQEKHAVLYKILMQEAEKYLSLGEVKKTFAIYDRALTIVAFSQRPMLIDKINELFSNVDIFVLEELYALDKLSQLEPFLIYEIGLNYLVESEFNKAKQILSSYEKKYPYHEHYVAICDLLRFAKENMFNKDLVGCALPLSGKYSEFGQRALSGIELALKDFQEKYNKKILILIKDTGGDKKRAAVVTQELCEKRVSSIIGPMVTAVSAGGVAEINETPMIAMTQKKLNLLEEKYLFSNFLTPELQTKALVSYAFADLNVKKFAILYPKDRYGEKYMNLFWDMVDEVGGEIRAVEAYNPDDTDFGEPLKKISGEYYIGKDDLEKDDVKNDDDAKDDNEEGKTEEEIEMIEQEEEKDFKAIFIPDTSTNVAQILPQLVYHDIKDVYLLGTKLWHRDNLIEDAAGYNKNAVIMEGYFSESEHEHVKKFAKDFTDLHGNAPGFIEAIAYDTASILFEILGNGEVNTKEELRNQIASNKVFDGVTGKTFFDEKGDLHKDLYYLTIQNRKFVEIKR